jgi:hypothetical protein
MNTPKLWSSILVIVGSIAMLVGALDPMEGWLVILPGSGLVTPGTFLSHRLSDVIALRGAQESARPAVGGWGQGSALRSGRVPGLCLYTSSAKKGITSILSLENGLLTLSLCP